MNKKIKNLIQTLILVYGLFLQHYLCVTLDQSLITVDGFLMQKSLDVVCLDWFAQFCLDWRCILPLSAVFVYYTVVRPSVGWDSCTQE